MAAFFISDTHFGHESIIGLANRPYASVDQMDEQLIQNWNSRVGPEDTVYHLGDFCFRNASGADHYLSRLNGNIHLICGNHDSHTVKHYSELFGSVQHYLEIKQQDVSIVLSHYPMREWNGVWKGAWHLFGHVHSRLDTAPLGYSLDVGVDSNNFHPLNLEQIKDVFQNRSNPFLGEKRYVGQ